ncbi:type II toxin-antitoxin system PemK/MazF family toxin [Synechococcus sp. MVIR-18-1]|uniref:type II toxin-antitoxin system PemK/MazF family toxin n=1 Tax=Synechococcus sp. MVIR-18-1 TaxID=1386941 RepID=UPI001644E8AD|nr:type II toxin-antitoxin system PemK/MazF family toxin [Synechococcus sp. MVIR-18-1]
MTAFPPFALVRVPFPFTERQAIKRRPALVLSKPAFQEQSGHLLLAMVTSARNSQWPTDWQIKDLQAAGLLQPCVVRFKVFTLDKSLLIGSFGALSEADRRGVQSRWIEVVALSPADPKP